MIPPKNTDDTSKNKDVVFNELEIDTLHEMMNISFGRAARDLSEVIDIYVVLSIPSMEVINASELPNFIAENIQQNASENTIICQNFLGDYNGICMVVFPSDDENKLLSLFQDENDSNLESMTELDLDNEIFLEIGNILIGTCVSKMAELIGESVIYQPPVVIHNNLISTNLYASIFDASQLALTLNTTFKFKEQDLHCYLFLITSCATVPFLKKAIVDYLRQFE
ncbi:chemotaxis protein CheC [Candidatus Magnetobacterium bavaricum]|uniref:Chemotaxis protein CheC n=1 Tax=Candidatus Magnetobacterium bavaricum TaxID=29290 RepID=A0A0F3GU06_9BACT|nr:chemotaxis protein CheC [Candidatus Magnetobacterium bavaricum]